MNRLRVLWHVWVVRPVIVASTAAHVLAILIWFPHTEAQLRLERLQAKYEEELPS